MIFVIASSMEKDDLDLICSVLEKSGVTDSFPSLYDAIVAILIEVVPTGLVFNMETKSIDVPQDCFVQHTSIRFFLHRLIFDSKFASLSTDITCLLLNMLHVIFSVDYVNCGRFCCNWYLEAEKNVDFVPQLLELLKKNDIRLQLSVLRLTSCCVRYGCKISAKDMHFLFSLLGAPSILAVPVLQCLGTMMQTRVSYCPTCYFEGISPDLRLSSRSFPSCRFILGVDGPGISIVTPQCWPFAREMHLFMTFRESLGSSLPSSHLFCCLSSSGFGIDITLENGSVVISLADEKSGDVSSNCTENIQIRRGVWHCLIVKIYRRRFGKDDLSVSLDGQVCMKKNVSAPFLTSDVDEFSFGRGFSGEFGPICLLNNIVPDSLLFAELPATDCIDSVSSDSSGLYENTDDIPVVGYTTSPSSTTLTDKRSIQEKCVVILSPAWSKGGVTFTQKGCSINPGFAFLGNCKVYNISNPRKAVLSLGGVMSFAPAVYRLLIQGRNWIVDNYALMKTSLQSDRIGDSGDGILSSLLFVFSGLLNDHFLNQQSSFVNQLPRMIGMAISCSPARAFLEEDISFVAYAIALSLDSLTVEFANSWSIYLLADTTIWFKCTPKVFMYYISAIQTRLTTDDLFTQAIGVKLCLDFVSKLSKHRNDRVLSKLRHCMKQNERRSMLEEQATLLSSVPCSTDESLLTDEALLFFHLCFSQIIIDIGVHLFCSASVSAKVKSNWSDMIISSICESTDSVAALLSDAIVVVLFSGKNRVGFELLSYISDSCGGISEFISTIMARYCSNDLEEIRCSGIELLSVIMNFCVDYRGVLIKLPSGIIISQTYCVLPFVDPRRFPTKNVTPSKSSSVSRSRSMTKDYSVDTEVPINREEKTVGISSAVVEAQLLSDIDSASVQFTPNKSRSPGQFSRDDESVFTITAFEANRLCQATESVSLEEGLQNNVNSDQSLVFLRSGFLNMLSDIISSKIESCTKLTFLCLLHFSLSDSMTTFLLNDSSMSINVHTKQSTSFSLAVSDRKSNTIMSVMSKLSPSTAISSFGHFRLVLVLLSLANQDLKQSIIGDLLVICRFSRPVCIQILENPTWMTVVLESIPKSFEDPSTVSSLTSANMVSFLAASRIICELYCNNCDTQFDKEFCQKNDCDSQMLSLLSVHSLAPTVVSTGSIIPELELSYDLGCKFMATILSESLIHPNGWKSMADLTSLCFDERSSDYCDQPIGSCHLTVMAVVCHAVRESLMKYESELFLASHVNVSKTDFQDFVDKNPIIWNIVGWFMISSFSIMRSRPFLQGLLGRGSDGLTDLTGTASNLTATITASRTSRIFRRQQSGLPFGRLSGYEQTLSNRLTSLQQCSYVCNDTRHEICTKLMDYCQNCGHSLTLHNVSHSKSSFIVSQSDYIHEYFSSFGKEKPFDSSFRDVFIVDEWAWFLMKTFVSDERDVCAFKNDEIINDNVFIVLIDSILAYILTFEETWSFHFRELKTMTANAFDICTPDTVMNEASDTFFSGSANENLNVDISVLCDDLVSLEKLKTVEFVCCESIGNRIVHVCGPSVLSHVIDDMFSSCRRNSSKLTPPKSNSSPDENIILIVLHCLQLFDAICWKDDDYIEGNKTFLSCTVEYVERESVVLTALRLSLFLLSSLSPTNCESLKVVARLRGIYSCIESYEGKFAARPLWVMLIFCHVFEALWHVRLSVVGLLQGLGFNMSVDSESITEPTTPCDDGILRELDELLSGIDETQQSRRIARLINALTERETLDPQVLSPADDEFEDGIWDDFIERMKKAKETVKQHQASDLSRINKIESFGSKWQDFMVSISLDEVKFQLIINLMSSPESVLLFRYCRLLTQLLVDLFQQNVTIFAASLGQIDYLALSKYCEKFRSFQAAESDSDNPSCKYKTNLTNWIHAHTQVVLSGSSFDTRQKHHMTFSSQHCRLLMLDRLCNCFKLVSDPVFDISLLKISQVAEAVSYLDSKEGDLIALTLTKAGIRLSEINYLTDKTLFRVPQDELKRKMSVLTPVKSFDGAVVSLSCISAWSSEFGQNISAYYDLRWRGCIVLWRRLMRKYRNDWSPFSSKLLGSDVIRKVSSHRDPLLRRFLLSPKYDESIPHLNCGELVSEELHDTEQSLRYLFWRCRSDNLPNSKADETFLLLPLETIVKEPVICTFPAMKITRKSRIFGELGLTSSSIYFRAFKIENRLAPSSVSSPTSHCCVVDDDSDEEDEGEPGHVLWDMWLKYDSNGRVSKQRLRCDEATENICSMFLSASAATVGPNAIWRFKLSEIVSVMGRRLFLAPCAIEIFFEHFYDSFFAFLNEDHRYRFVGNLKALHVPSLEKSILISPVDSFEASTWTSSWKKGEMTNYEYIVRLNQFGGRSINDLSQYLVFPWILSFDKTNSTSTSNFRDLSKPIGALNDTRLAEFRSRVAELLQYVERDLNYDFSLLDDNGDKFLYGSHYSNSAIVLHYLLRQEPYTSLNRDVQGGKFDLADRLFYDLGVCWNSSYESMTDVKELIPEFFYFPEMFLNSSRLDFGELQDSKMVVSDVIIPACLNSDPYGFVAANLEALESDCVSNELHNWIDLIFGYKQRGLNALYSDNLFHCLTYEGCVNLDSIEDVGSRNATKDQIMFYGQTPSQLLSIPHPQRDTSQTFSGLLCSSEKYAKNIAIFFPPRQFADVSNTESSPSSWKHGTVISLDSVNDRLVVVYQDLYVVTYKVNTSVSIEGNPVDVKIERAKELQSSPQLVWSQLKSNMDFTERNQIYMSIRKPADANSLLAPKRQERRSFRQTMSSFLSRNRSVSEAVKIESIDKDSLKRSSSGANVCMESGDFSRMDINASVILRGPIANIGGSRWTTSTGRIVVYGFLDGSVRFFDTAFGREICRTYGHLDSVLCCSIPVDSPCFATGDSAGVLRLWSVDTARTPSSPLLDVEPLEKESQFESFSFAHDTDTPVDTSQTSFKPIRCLHEINCHTSAIVSMQFNSFADIIVSASEDGLIAVHEAKRGKFIGLIDSFCKTSHKPSLVRADSNGHIFVHCWKNLSLHAFSVNGHHIAEISVMQSILTMEVTSNSRILICGRDDGGISFRLSSDLTQVHLVEASSHGAIHALRFSADSRHILVGSSDGNFGVCYDAELTVRMIKTAIDMSLALSNERALT